MEHGGQAGRGKPGTSGPDAAARTVWPFDVADYPHRSHGASGRRSIWSKVLGWSESQLAWWSLDGRLAKMATSHLPGWRVDRDATGRHLERIFTPGGLGEAVLLLHHLHWLQWTTNASSRFEWRLDLNGRVAVVLRDDEAEEVTLDDGLMALLVSRAGDARRRKRSRVRRLLRRLARALGRGPALLGAEALSEGLATRPEWVALQRQEHCVGILSAYLFSGRSGALLFAGGALAILGHLWVDLKCEVGISDAIATVILHGEPRAWPSAELFSAADFLAELAAANGGQAQSSELSAGAADEFTAGDLRLAMGGPERPPGATPEPPARDPAERAPESMPLRGTGFSCWMDPEEAERVDHGAVSRRPCDP